MSPPSYFIVFLMVSFLFLSITTYKPHTNRLIVQHRGHLRLFRISDNVDQFFSKPKLSELNKLHIMHIRARDKCVYMRSEKVKSNVTQWIAIGGRPAHGDS